MRLSQKKGTLCAEFSLSWSKAKSGLAAPAEVIHISPLTRSTRLAS